MLPCDARSGDVKKQQWMKKCAKVHGNKYNYDLWPENVKSSIRVPNVCPRHGLFEQILDNHVHGKGCPVCGNISRGSSNLKNKAYYTDRCIVTHGLTYDYSFVPAFPTSSEKVTIVCALHGKFLQSMDSHIHGNGCPRCAVIVRTQTMYKKYGVCSPRQIIVNSESLSKLNNKDWMVEQYTVLQKTTIDIAQELGVNAQTVANYLHAHNIQMYQQHSTSSGEREIADICSKHTAVILNSRNIIPPKELDIFLPEYNIAIEFCGLYWHSEQAGKDKQYHAAKYHACATKNIRLITIFDDEWRLRRKQITRKLLYLLNKDDSTDISARSTVVVPIDSKSKRQFFNENHIQGNGPGSISYALINKEQIVAAITFIKKANGVYVLNRYATSCRVPGGFSKLLAHFKNNHEWNTIETFADLRWSAGALYRNTGWNFIGIIPPDYYYSPKGAVYRVHKFNYRRNMLPKLLTHFNPDLTETENCDNNGVLRIWDCGKLKFALVNDK